MFELFCELKLEKVGNCWRSLSSTTFEFQIDWKTSIKHVGEIMVKLFNRTRLNELKYLANIVQEWGRFTTISLILRIFYHDSHIHYIKKFHYFLRKFNYFKGNLISLKFSNPLIICRQKIPFSQNFSSFS